jgi:hypothetical protein
MVHPILSRRIIPERRRRCLWAEYTNFGIINIMPNLGESQIEFEAKPADSNYS